MGQQQLLLLALGIVIVGLSIVVGIAAFAENQKRSNADALVADAVRIASDAQAWSLKPTAFGGGDGSFEGAAFERLVYDAPGGLYESLNASADGGGPGSGFVISDVTAGGLTVTGCNAARGNRVVAVVSGLGPGDIATEVDNVTACE